MKTVDNFEFARKKAIVRVDFNVPLNKEFVITDTTRIDAAIPTIKKIINDGGSAILMSHLGRPKNGPEQAFSLNHLLPYLSQALGVKVQFADDCIGAQATKKAAALKPGEVLLLENLRFYKEETKGDKAFAEQLATLADVYVNDAFGTAHRAHASTAIIADAFDDQHKMFGYIMANEVENIGKVLTGAEKPYTAIIGGAKVSGKIQIIENLIDKVDNLIIGGGMVFTFVKALGGKIGNSLVEDEFLALALHTIEKAKKAGVNLVLPVDVKIADAFANDAKQDFCATDAIPDGWLGLDVGPKSIEMCVEVIAKSKTILWNGPMGVFEMSSFEEGTKAVAYAIKEATQHNGAFSLIGGGDSVAAINKYKLKADVSYVSTGGGAMLEFIEGKTLPGVAAIEK